MLFNKSIISFFAAIALASSVTAAVTPNQNQDQNPNQNQNPSNPTTGGQGQQVKAQDVVPTCSTGTPTCCGSTTPFSGLTPAQQTELHSLDSKVNEGLNTAFPVVMGVSKRVGDESRWQNVERNAGFGVAHGPYAYNVEPRN
ncbi:hypothetical protein EI94DRAFT_1699212 [Lactarius quietus]|nr:hypothetical protein EI94DRAFT_1699212 [Lactarius quietus]